LAIPSCMQYSRSSITITNINFFKCSYYIQYWLTPKIPCVFLTSTIYFCLQSIIISCYKAFKLRTGGGWIKSPLYQANFKLTCMHRNGRNHTKDFLLLYLKSYFSKLFLQFWTKAGFELDLGRVFHGKVLPHLLYLEQGFNP
jgi:hypothetical protein